MISVPLEVAIKRLAEYGSLYKQLLAETNNKKFWEINKRLQELETIYKLEDQLNKGGVDNV